MRARINGAARDTFRSMHVRNFRLFFSGQLISQVGNWLTLIAQTLLVLKITNSAFDVGLLTAFQFAPVLLFGAWAGLIADRSDKRRLLIIVQAFAMLQSFALAFFAFMHHPPVVAFFVVAFFGGLAMAFDNPARRAFVVEMVPDTYVNNAVSLNSALMTSARIVGPAFAGLLIATVGYGWCFSVDAFTYIAVIIGLWMIVPGELRPSPVAERGRRQVRAGLAYVRRVPDLWIPLAMMAVIGTLAFNFNVVMPVFVKRTFHGNDTTFTLLYSVLSVGSLIGALASARRRSITVRHVVAASLAFGVMMCVLAAAPSLGAAFPIGVLLGVSSISFMTASTAIVQVRADPSMRGRVLALQAIVFLGSTPIGGPILGWVCQDFGARAGLLVGGIATIAAAGFGEFAHRRSRDRVALVGALDTAELQVA
jgi:MFS family permease